MISCRNLTRRFNGFTAVDNLTLEIPAGTIAALLGPNGAGKSTTLRMLSGLLAPTSGEAAVAGVDVGGDAVELRRRIGVLPEELGLFDDLTIEEHLLLTGRVYGVRDTRTRAEQLLGALDLEAGRATPAARCSHGMRKKTALAMALLPNPRVLLLDEPFEAIDPASSRAIHEMLLGLAARGGTVLLTSHILTAVAKIASRVAVMRKGRLVLDSPATERIEELYFELIDCAPVQGLEWLGSPQS